jgi:hypothetical protein
MAAIPIPRYDDPPRWDKDPLPCTRHSPCCSIGYEIGKFKIKMWVQKTNNLIFVRQDANLGTYSSWEMKPYCGPRNATGWKCEPAPPRKGVRKHPKVIEW